MHKNKLTHTDLKPENILLQYEDLKRVPFKTYSKKTSGRFSRSSTRSQSKRPMPKMTYEPVYDKIKLIDMGGATWDHEHHSTIINTRQYRSPEVILNCMRWNHKSDIWSIGCILYELFSGKFFFPTHEDYEHMAMIEKMFGKVPRWMAERCSTELQKNFILDDDIHYKFRKTYFDWPRDSSSYDSVKHVREF